MEPRISPEMSIDEVTRQYPQTADIFVRHRMACVGCSLGIFHTVTEVASIYQIEVETFIAQLNGQIDSPLREDKDM